MVWEEQDMFWTSIQITTTLRGPTEKENDGTKGQIAWVKGRNRIT
jgi:hypothetical protein